MKRLLMAAAAVTLLMPALVSAGDWRPGYSAVVQAQHQFKKKGPARFQRGERSARRHDRLTDDERRELHRDLDRADREIYRGMHQREPPVAPQDR
jgi:opacity protein-like surface antigen